MPTARELLEQADALMRRNRPQPAAAEGDQPAPSEEISVADAAEDGAASELAPEADHEALGAPPAPVADSPTEVEYPLLTDAIDPALAAIPVGDRGQLPDEGDDVPVLTDAISALGDEPMVEAGGDGEPSIWPEADQGEHSVLGRAPDSVISVPPVQTAPAADHLEPGDRPEGSIDQTTRPSSPEESPVPSLAGVESPPRAREIDDIDVALGLHAPPEWGKADIPAAWAPPSFEPDSSIEPRPAPETEPVALAQSRADPPSSRDTEPVSAGEPPGMESLPAEYVAGEQQELPAPQSRPAPEAQGAALAALAPAEGASGAGAGQRDDAQWAALAEDIRMQVLQRIDIFTDTGLRGQLGERLKPVVDRASAELLDTINHHVGDLLRAYVAEAIEREIDRWRSGRS